MFIVLSFCTPVNNTDTKDLSPVDQGSRVSLDSALCGRSSDMASLDDLPQGLLLPAKGNESSLPPNPTTDSFKAEFL